MSDIELVVKISEEEYINIKDAINSLIENGVERASMSKICLAILDGVPIPKGHGRLIDADEIQFENTDFDTYGDYCRAFDAIDQADTIIEADRSDEE